MKGATKAWHGQSAKTAKKLILCAYPTWDFERRSGDSRVQTIGATQGAHGQWTEIGNKLILYELRVTAAPHPVPPCLNDWGFYIDSILTDVKKCDALAK